MPSLRQSTVQSLPNISNATTAPHHNGSERLTPVLEVTGRGVGRWWALSGRLGAGLRQLIQEKAGGNPLFTAFQNGGKAERRLVYNYQHGAWLEWLDCRSNA